MLLWLGTLCLIPFDLASLDSSNSSKKLVNDLLEMVKVYLGCSGPTREAAAICVSSLLTRPDMQSVFLHDYLQWSVEIVDKFVEFRDPKYQFLYLGSLHSLAQIFKKGHREKLLSFVELVWSSISKAFEKAEQISERKFLAKILQRIGMTLLPVREASWRYQRGKRSLNFLSCKSVGVVEVHSSVEPPSIHDDDNFEVSPVLEDIIDKLLQCLGDKDTVVRWSAAKGIGRIAMRLPKSFGDEIVNAIVSMFDEEDDDSRWHGGCLALAELTRRGLLLPEKLPKVVPIVSSALHFDILKGQHGIGSHVRDSASYVCWSFARAYAPNVMSSYVSDLSVSMLTAILFDREINCRRAAAAAFQENVGRQGNENFPHGIEFITIADFFSVGNRQSCFLELAPQIASFETKYVSVFIHHLVEYKLSHWDREIRELAAQSIARFLYVNQASYDVDGLVTKLVADVENVSLAIRHGAVLGLGRVIFALSARGLSLLDNSRHAILTMILDIEKKRVFRGRGGEMVREAMCILIQSVVQSGIVESQKSHVAIVEFVNEQLRQPHMDVQLAAQSALRHCLFSFFGDHSKGTPSDRLQKLTVLKYLEGLTGEQNVAATRGYALALGALCSRLFLKPDDILPKVLSTLARFASSSMRIAGEYDAETCKICVDSVIEIFEKVCHHASFNSDLLELFLNIFLRGCEDYNVDKRGDTGSWSRMASLVSLERFVVALSDNELLKSKCYESSYGVFFIAMSDGENIQRPVVAKFPVNSIGRKAADDSKWILFNRDSAFESPTFVLSAYHLNTKPNSLILDEEALSRIYSAIVKQLSEKLNNVREIAGQALARVNAARKFLQSGNRFEIDLFFDDLMSEFFSKHSLIDWSSPEQTFSLICKCLINKNLTRSTLEGLVISIGGLTESVSREATKAFVALRESSSYSQVVVSIIRNLVLILEEKPMDDRIVIPLVKSIDTFYRQGIFADLPNDEKINWNANIFNLLRRQLSFTTNVAKIIVIIDVIVMVVSSVDGSPDWNQQVALLVNLLTHKYPRVRKCQFYINL